MSYHGVIKVSRRSRFFDWKRLWPTSLRIALLPASQIFSLRCFNVAHSINNLRQNHTNVLQSTATKEPHEYYKHCFYPEKRLCSPLLLLLWCILWHMISSHHMCSTGYNHAKFEQIGLICIVTVMLLAANSVQWHLYVIKYDFCCVLCKRNRIMHRAIAMNIRIISHLHSLNFDVGA